MAELNRRREAYTQARAVHRDPALWRGEATVTEEYRLRCRADDAERSVLDALREWWAQGCKEVGA